MVRVWDPVVRLLHWHLAAFILLAWLTADGMKTAHEALGYAIGGLVVLRLLWGVIGPRHARFASFVKGPAATLGYLDDLRRGRERRFLGHNPAGAAMIVALLAVVAGTVASGLLLESDAFWGSEMMEEAHEAAAILILVLVAVHVGGVIHASLRHGENLVFSMIDGRKPAGDSE
ncbi:cytochrome b/b6 domain-containing protein [Seohaeicola zhoushanensis]|uniref:Cytochrome b561 n=1 Tax=Seohaeicola zhoushanensis TaxID=1569283 RepID=A0A8J3GV49_9RHOB|nr:cytochrome b/b6 domain-containing protein [Seohaeicola zhoushanensis]GHF42429.1 cytochrome b561 [Seohaeicola zhoushanensis]